MIDLSSICPPITTTSFSQPPSQPSPLSSQPSSRRQRQESSSRSALPSTSSTTSRRSRRNTANSSDQPSSEMSSASPVNSGPQNTTDVILTRVFQDQTNVLKRDDRELIIEFLNGRLRGTAFFFVAMLTFVWWAPSSQPIRSFYFSTPYYPQWS